ncbi:MAG: hypothetical protein RIB86_23170 [Imperialibacter sp.]
MARARPVRTLGWEPPAKVQLVGCDPARASAVSSGVFMRAWRTYLASFTHYPGSFYQKCVLLSFAE